jgi:glycosyltransferase involved in cell wall biosynthesis
LLRVHGRFADTVVAISPGIAEALGDTRAHVLLNPVGIPLPETFTPPAARSAGEPLRLVVVGTVDRHKRQDLAISALTELVASGHDAHLELIGGEADPTYSTELRTLATSSGVTDRITFSGQRNDVAQRVSSADMLLLPAGEVTPLVLMEAMALGTPVIAARMGSIPDVVGDAGLLVPPDDAPAMATAAATLATNPTLATSLATSARTRIETHYDQRHSHTNLEAEITRLTSLS